MSRLTIEITEDQHQSIKAVAALQGQSIKEYAMQRLFAPDNSEEQTMQEAKLAKLKAHWAIGKAQADRGEFADYSLEKINAEVDEEYKKRKAVDGKI